MKKKERKKTSRVTRSLGSHTYIEKYEEYGATE